jgi:cyclase
VAAAVDVPVIASGGAGSASDLRDVLDDGCADAALVAGILHDELTTVRAIKALLASSGLPVRAVA